MTTITIGEQEYAVEPKHHPDGCFVVRKLKGDQQTIYTVFPKSSVCSCEAAKFNPGTQCKHVSAIKEYVAAGKRWQRRFERIKPFTIWIDQYLPSENKP